MIMSPKTINEVLERAKTWPMADQETLAEFAREIESNRTGVYALDAEEREAIERGLKEASSGKFASAEEMLSLKTRFGTV
jgi:predicted transcriptional regulator